jgi:hypothetical protein
MSASPTEMLKALGAAGEDIEELGANEHCHSVQGDSFSVAPPTAPPRSTFRHPTTPRSSTPRPSRGEMQGLPGAGAAL